MDDLTERRVRRIRRAHFPRTASLALMLALAGAGAIAVACLVSGPVEWVPVVVGGAALAFGYLVGHVDGTEVGYVARQRENQAGASVIARRRRTEG